MAAGFVQVGVKSFGAGGISSAQFAYANPQTNGNTNIVCVNFAGAVSEIDLTDSSGNTYKQALSTSWSGGGQTAQTYYSIGIQPASQNTVTIVFNGSVTFLSLILVEYSGLVSPVDVTAALSGSSVGPISSGSATTTNANDLIFGFVVANNGNATTAGSTQRFNNGSFGIEDATVSSTGSNSISWTVSATTAWVGQMVA